MLISIETGKKITNIPYEEEYNIWRSRLSQDQYDAIIQELNNRIDSDEVHTSSWMPGADWGNSVFQAIYENSCLRNEEASAKCFGLFLWVVMKERTDTWSFGRYEKNNIPIEGLTYFKLNNPPPQ